MIGTALTPYEVLGNDTEVYVLNEAGNLIFNHDGANLAQVNAGQLARMPAGVYLIAYNLFSSTAGMLILIRAKPARFSLTSPARSSCRRRVPYYS
jgi:uncharacterized RmlC-like cupin family protein